MGLNPLLPAIACAGLLVLALFAALQAPRNPLALTLALFCADLSVWSFGSLAYDLTHEPRWHWLDVTFSPLTPALGLHFVLSFTGRSRELRALRRATYAYFGILALVALADRGAERATSSLWSIVFLVGIVAAVVVAVTLLIAHRRSAQGPEERARTLLLFLALPLGAVVGATDLIASLTLSIPRLAPLGTILCALLMAVVTLRLRLFGPVVSRGEAVAAAVLAALAMVAYLGVFRLFGTNWTVLVVATTALTFALLAVVRVLVTSAGLERSRLRELSTLGSFSAQLAHDLKNPLAALKGAAQFLKEERIQGRSLDDNAEFIDLMADQVERLESVIEHYQKWSRVEPVLGVVDVNHLVSGVLGLQVFATSASVRIVRELEADLPACTADRDLLVRVLTNLVQNGFEAMPESGVLTVRTARWDRGQTSGVRIIVEDSGHGMDARTRERAFDDFYTTKAGGTGLGLAFVRRVLVAHGGEATLTSRVGRGTAVLLWLPTQPQR